MVSSHGLCDQAKNEPNGRSALVNRIVECGCPQGGRTCFRSLLQNQTNRPRDRPRPLDDLRICPVIQRSGPRLYTGRQGHSMCPYLPCYSDAPDEAEAAPSEEADKGCGETICLKMTRLSVAVAIVERNAVLAADREAVPIDDAGGRRLFHRQRRTGFVHRAVARYIMSVAGKSTRVRRCSRNRQNRCNRAR
jgi:hypothetical protein